MLAAFVIKTLFKKTIPTFLFESKKHVWSANYYCRYKNISVW